MASGLIALRLENGDAALLSLSQPVVPPVRPALERVHRDLVHRHGILSMEYNGNHESNPEKYAHCGNEQRVSLENETK